MLGRCRPPARSGTPGSSGRWALAMRCGAPGIWSATSLSPCCSRTIDGRRPACPRWWRPDPDRRQYRRGTRSRGGHQPLRRSRPRRSKGRAVRTKRSSKNPPRKGALQADHHRSLYHQPEVFDQLATDQPGAGNEIQLTDEGARRGDCRRTGFSWFPRRRGAASIAATSSAISKPISRLACEHPGIWARICADRARRTIAERPGELVGDGAPVSIRRSCANTISSWHLVGAHLVRRRCDSRSAALLPATLAETGQKSRRGRL